MNKIFLGSLLFFVFLSLIGAQQSSLGTDVKIVNGVGVKPVSQYIDSATKEYLSQQALKIKQLEIQAIGNLNEGNYYQAIEKFLKINRFNQYNWQSYLGIAFCYYYLGNNMSALKYVQKSLFYKKTTYGLILKVELYRKLGQIQKAKGFLKANFAAKINPSYVLEKILLETSLGQLSLAKKQLQKFLLIEPENINAVRLLLLIHQYENNYFALEQLINQYKIMASDNFYFQKTAAQVYLSRGMINQAKDFIEKMQLLKPYQKSTIQYTCLLYYWENEYQKGLDYLKKQKEYFAHQKNIDFSQKEQAWFEYMEGCFYSVFKNNYAALEHFIKAFQLDQYQFAYGLVLLSYYGPRYQDNIKDPKIVALLKKLSPVLSTSMYNIASNWGKQYDFDLMSIYARWSLQINPNNDTLREQLAQLYYREGFFQRALDFMNAGENKTSKNNPKYQLFYNQLREQAKNTSHTWSQDIQPISERKTIKMGLYTNQSKNTLDYFLEDQYLLDFLANTSTMSNHLVQLVLSKGVSNDSLVDALADAQTHKYPFFIMVKIYSKNGRDIIQAKYYRTGSASEIMEKDYIYQSSEESMHFVDDFLSDIQIIQKEQVIDVHLQKVLIHAGKWDGLKKGDQLDIIHQGHVFYQDQCPYLGYDQNYLYGRITLDHIGTYYSEGYYTYQGYYNLVSPGDDVINRKNTCLDSSDKKNQLNMDMSDIFKQQDFSDRLLAMNVFPDKINLSLSKND